jgi:hypothetical protein
MKTNKDIRILFIGNSYTYYNNLPGLLAYFAKNSLEKVSVKTKMIVQGGVNLKYHWNEKKALKEIRSKRYDYVVLQEQSRLGGTYENGILRVAHPETFFDYARRFDTAIKKAGAKTIFFLTWARQDFPNNQSKLNAAYKTIAKRLKATLVPVGPAWQIVRKTKPRISLYSEDQSHPSPLGTYLIGCTFYSVLFDSDPIGLPSKAYQSTSRKIPSSPKMIKLSEKDARFLQEIAWKEKRKWAKK